MDATDIADYNGYVTEHAGRNDLLAPYADQFTALASTQPVNARDNTATGLHYIGTPTYWVGGNPVAADYADFYDNTWDSNAPWNETGALLPGADPYVFTGTNRDGTDRGPYALSRSEVIAGKPKRGSYTPGLHGGMRVDKDALIPSTCLSQVLIDGEPAGRHHPTAVDSTVTTKVDDRQNHLRDVTEPDRLTTLYRRSEGSSHLGTCLCPTIEW